MPRNYHRKPRIKSLAPPIARQSYPSTVIDIFNIAERELLTEETQVGEQLLNTLHLPQKAGSIKDSINLISDTGTTIVKTPTGKKSLCVLLDFGKVVYGELELSFEAESGGMINVTYGYEITDNHITQLSDDLYSDIIQYKKGDLNWKSPAKRLFRFLQLDFKKSVKPLKIRNIHVNEVMRQIKAVFKSNDENLNHLWDSAINAAELHIRETFYKNPLDTTPPQWWMVREMAKAAFILQSDCDILHDSISKLAAASKSRKLLPDSWSQPENIQSIDASILWLFSVLDYYVYSGNIESVRKSYKHVANILGLLDKYVSDNGLLKDVPFYSVLKKPSCKSGTYLTALNALYAQGLLAASVIANILGEEADSKSFFNKSEKIKEILNRSVVSHKTGVFYDGLCKGKVLSESSAAANALALMLGITDYYLRLSVIRNLTTKIYKPENTAFVDTMISEALYNADEHGCVLDLTLRRWSAIKSSASAVKYSFWLIITAKDIIGQIVGLKPTMDKNRFVLAPKLCNLKWIECSLQLPGGLAEVKCSQTHNLYLIDLVIPENTKIDVYIPLGAGTKIKADGKIITSQVVTLDSGKHEIKCTNPHVAAKKNLPSLPEPKKIHVLKY